MRTFRMFFALSIGVLLFFFVAKFLVLAFIAAAILSLVFGGLRRLKYRMQSRYEDRYFDYYRHRQPLFQEEEEWAYDRLPKVHYVEVR
ncbi:MAG: hypothetical protein AAGG75_10340 [Bacteroidota bacterium]